MNYQTETDSSPMSVQSEPYSPIIDNPNASLGAYFSRQDSVSGAEELIRKSPKKQRRSDVGKIKSNPSHNYAIRGLSKNALECIVGLKAAAKAQDMTDLGLIGSDFKEVLHDIWCLREGKDENWRAIVNFMQSSMASIIIEKMTVPQCEVLESVAGKFLQGIVDPEDVLRAVDALENVGFDPLSPIRGLSDQE